MARIRTIKPEFFTSEDIVSLTPLARLFYVSLWCESDREGRFEWKPKTLKFRYLPGDTCNVDALGDELVQAGLIVLYEVDGKKYAEIPGFKKHQVINNRESESTIPPICADATLTRESAVKAEGKEGREGKGKQGKGIIAPPTPKGEKSSAEKPKTVSVADLTAQGVDELVAKEFIALRDRKRAKLTELALAGIQREAAKAGWTLEAALRKAVERGWQSFEADWLKGGGGGKPTAHTGFEKQDYHKGVAADGTF